MAKHTYVYVTYILSTPEKVWKALTDAKISASYWGRENVSDWKVGSDWQHQLPGKSADVVGKVLESDPPRRLVTSWARPGDLGLGGESESNDLYDRAVAVVTRDGKASTSYIQRRLQIGYNRAASLMERMEQEGVVGAANHAGKREILVSAAP